MAWKLWKKFETLTLTHRQSDQLSDESSISTYFKSIGVWQQ